MADGEWIPLTPQLRDTRCTNTGTGNWRNRRGHCEMDYVTDGHRIIGIHGGDP